MVITACARGHGNDRAAKFCATCGLAMVQASVLASSEQRSRHESARPLGGVLALENRRFHLGDRAIVGRLPERSASVANRVATAVAIDEPGVSGVHAQFHVVGWETELTDLGSTNGTHVWDGARDRWHRVSSPVIVTDGAAICFGSVLTRFWQTG